MPVRMRLTKSLVEGLQPPQHGSTVVFDSEVRGFAVRVRLGRGATQARVWRTYVFRYQEGYGRKGSKDRWLKIGEHGEPWSHAQTGRAQALTVDAARTMALWLRGVKNGGGDPRAALRPSIIQQKPKTATLRAFAPVYLEKHADAHKSLDSAKEDARLLKKHVLPALGDTPLDQITRAMVSDFHVSMGSTPTNANRVLALLAKVLSVARDRGVLPEGHVNPCRGVKKFKERKRDRYLSPTELLAIGAALTAEEVARPYAVAAIRILALTGARPNEILTLKLDQLHLELGHVIVMRKGRPLPIYLPKPAIEILESLRPKPGNPYVFPGWRVANHVSLGMLDDLWERARDAARCPDVRLYDIRHTFASVAVQGGESLPMIGALMGHTRPETTQRYAHLAPSPVRKAGARTARAIAKALKGG